jgi:hypothetical protein
MTAHVLVCWVNLHYFQLADKSTDKSQCAQPCLVFEGFDTRWWLTGIPRDRGTG